jgi:hypothetical protein
MLITCWEIAQFLFAHLSLLVCDGAQRRTHVGHNEVTGFMVLKVVLYATKNCPECASSKLEHLMRVVKD